VHRDTALDRDSRHDRRCRPCTSPGQNTTYLCQLLETGPDPIPLPREPRLKTPAPQEDLKEFKDSFGQGTGTSTANLIHELDSTLELAYTIKESLSQDETLRMALTSVGIGANTVEHFDCMLQEILQKVLPIAQHVCKFSKGWPVDGIRLRTRCTSRKLEGLSKLRKSLHRVAMQHREQEKKSAINCVTWYKQN